ncbi:hypothetical protein [Nonomuraea sp. JJY05]|uniref:hypothetical protein n=1 Tax=Nonomuraea sp. JJY05 TaxID=3350255 RepID=UPI00373F5C1D
MPAAIALAVMVWLAVTNFAALLNVPQGDPLTWILPGLYGVTAVIGVIWAFILRAGQPAVYSLVGMGAKAATAQDGV